MDYLTRALDEAIDRNKNETKRWTMYRDEHVQAEENLLEFVKSLEVNVMVPIGNSKALFPGKLQHTNEVLVSHTQGYFSKCSTHQAVNICKHRLKIADQRLEALETEREMYQNKKDLPFVDNAFLRNNPDEIEIIEEYNEDNEKLWRIEHRKRLRQAKQNEQLERKKLIENTSDTDIFTMLDELELMDELESELNELEITGKENELNDDMLKKLMSGEMDLPSSKKRISLYNTKKIDEHDVNSNHDNNMTINQPDKNITLSDQIHENILDINGNPNSNSEDEDDADEDDNVVDGDDDADGDDEDDDEPIAFTMLKNESAKFSLKEKLIFFKKHLTKVQDIVQSTRRSRNPAELDKFADNIVLRDCIIDTIEKLRDEITHNAYITKCERLNRINDAVTAVTAAATTAIAESNNPIIVPNDKKNHTNIKFDKQDYVASFHESDESYKITRELPKITNIIESLTQPSLPTLSEQTNSKTNNKDDCQIDADSIKTIKFKHSERVYNPSSPSDEENSNNTNDFNHILIQSPADFYTHFANCMKMSTNQLQEKQKMMDFVTKVADLDLTNLDERMKSAFKERKDPKLVNKTETKCLPIMMNNANQNKSENNVKKSILKNKEAVNQEEHIRIQSVKADLEEIFKFCTNNTVPQSNVELPTSSDSPQQCDPLPDGDFIDTHAPKRRISKFKASRMNKNNDK